MRFSTLFLAGLGLAAGASGASAQQIQGDSTSDGRTVLVIRDVLEDIVQSFEHYHLLLLDASGKPTDLLPLESYLSKGRTAGEFDFRFASDSGDYLLALASPADGTRRLFHGRVADGHFLEMEKLLEFHGSDRHWIFKPSLSPDGKVRACILQDQTLIPDDPDQLAQGSYSLWIQNGKETRTIENVRPAMALSRDGSRIAYLKPGKDSYDHIRFKSSFLVVEPADGKGEPRTLAHGFLIADPRYISLIWAPDGRSLYAIGSMAGRQSPAAGDKVSNNLPLFYKQPVKPALIRFQLSEDGAVEKIEKIWKHEPGFWVKPSPNGRWIFAFSTLTKKQEQAWFFEADTGSKALYREGDRAGRPCPGMIPAPVLPRYLPVWKDDDHILMLDLPGGWLKEQEVGHDPILLPKESQKLVEFFSSPKAARNYLDDQAARASSEKEAGETEGS